MLKTAAWLVRILVFLLLLGLAIKNSGAVTVHFFFSKGWEVPLVLLLLVSFGIGALAGASVAAVAVYRQRREIERLRREAQTPPPQTPEVMMPDVTAI